MQSAVDWKSFSDSGGSDKQKADAKHHNNQIHPPLIKSEFSEAIVPSPLHLTLGLVHRFFDMFEAFAKTLDSKVIEMRGESPRMPAAQLHKEMEREIAVNTEIAALEAKIVDAEETVSMLQVQISELDNSGDDYARALDADCVKRSNVLREAISVDRKDVASKTKELQSIEATILKNIGPFQCSIRALMRSLSIRRQSYHGGSFVGNDCIKILKNGYGFASIVQPTLFDARRASATSTALIPLDHSAASRFGTLFSKLRLCVDLYSKPRYLCSHEIRALQLRCASIGNWFPRNFPTESLPPKFHLLTQHIPQFADRWHTVGLASEQPIESTHRIMNRLDRTYATVSDPVKVRSQMAQFHLEGSSLISDVKPTPRLCSKCGGHIAATSTAALDRCQCAK